MLQPLKHVKCDVGVCGRFNQICMCFNLSILPCNDIIYL